MKKFWIIGMAVLMFLSIIAASCEGSGGSSSSSKGSAKDYYKENYKDVYDYMEREGF